MFYAKDFSLLDVDRSLFYIVYTGCLYTRIEAYGESRSISKRSVYFRLFCMDDYHVYFFLDSYHVRVVLYHFFCFFTYE